MAGVPRQRGHVFGRSAVAGARLGHVSTGIGDPANIELAAASVVASFVGGLILSRRPGNNVGWLLAAVGLFGAVAVLANGYVAWGLSLGHAPVFGDWAAWVSEWAWAPQYLLVPGLLPLIFPDGRLMSRRWVPAVITSIALILVVFVVSTAAGDYLVANYVIPNPFPVHLGYTLGSPREPAAVPIALAGFTAQLVLATASLVLRWQRADAVVRAQLKWFFYGVGVLAFAVVMGLIPPMLSLMPATSGPQAVANSLLNQFQGLAFAFVVISIGVAVFKYRLYDIDLIINWTLVYGGLTAILAGLYAAIVTLGQRLFIAVTGQKSDAAIVLTAFALGALFTPLRDTLQRLVNRRLGSGNPNASLDTLNETIDSVVAVFEGETIARRVLRAAVTRYGARFGELHLDESASGAVFHREGAAAGHADLEVPIQSDGRCLGRLVLGERRRGVYSSEDRETLRRSADAIARALMFAAGPRHAAQLAAEAQPA